MDKTLSITRNELRRLLYSPLSWILLVIFAIQTGARFCGTLGRILRLEALRLSTNGITISLFQDNWSGVFPVVKNYLFLYASILTMGLLSSEKDSGTDRLFLSSPVTSAQVVTGKYLAVVIFGLLMFCVMIPQIVFGGIVVQSLDWGAVAAALTGLFLLWAAYAAIGLFMSSLTRYQIIAAVGTAATIFLLNSSTRIGQSAPVIRDITYWLGISGRAETFIAGMISSEDVIYFLSIIALFLAFSVFRLEGGIRKRKTAQNILRYGGVFAALCAVAFVSSRPALKKYADLTEIRYNTLTPSSQKVMKEIEGPLTITTYDNLLAANMLDAAPSNYKRDVSRFERYLRFRPETKMRYVYYYKECPDNPLNARIFKGLDEEGKAKAAAKLYRLNLKKFLTPSEIDAKADLKSEGYNFVRIITDGRGRSSRLRLYEDMEKHPGEAEITAAMKRLVFPSTSVTLLTGAGERASDDTGDEGYYTFTKSRTFRQALINQGFDINDYAYDGGEIPDSVSILLISDPKSAYSVEELTAIWNYIRRGGDLFIAGKPGSRDFLAPALDSLGLKFMPGTVVQEGSRHAADLVVGDFTGDAVLTSQVYKDYIARKYHIVGSGCMAIDASEAVKKGFRTYDIAVTDTLSSDSTKVWCETSAFDVNDETPEFDSADIPLKKAPLVEGLERNVDGKSQRIIVLGNSDFVSNGELLSQHAGVSAANYALVTESFRWLSGGEFPVDVSRPAGPDNSLRHIGRPGGRRAGWILCGILPFVMALFGGCIIYRRRSL